MRKSCLARFLKTFTQSFFKGKKDLSKPLDYFNLIIYLIKLNSLIAHFLIYEELLIDSVDLFLQIQKTLNGTFSISSAIAKEKEKYHATNVELLFQIVDALTRSCVTGPMLHSKVTPPTYLFNSIDWQNCPKIPEKIIDRLLEADTFVKFLLPMSEKCPTFNLFIQHISWEDEEASKKIIQQLIAQNCRYYNRSFFLELTLFLVNNHLIINLVSWPNQGTLKRILDYSTI